MDDQEIARRLDELNTKLDAVHASSEKTRTYLLWMFIGAVAAFVLPLVGLLFAIPSFLSTYDMMANIGI